MAALIAFGMIVGLGWPSAGEVNSARDTVYQQSEFQKELPPGYRAEPGEGPARVDPNRKIREPSGRRESTGGSGGASFLLWLVMGGIILGIVGIWAREWSSTARRRGARVIDEAVAIPMVQLDRKVLTEAEAFANRGQFAEAVHAMLLRTFETIGAQRALPPALTSREILERARLSDGARVALGDLVLAVERTLFGGADATVEDYSRCVSSYERVLAADGVELR